MHHVPILTIDGPSGSGKGTVSQLLATKMKWHYLDSGAIYRALGYLASQNELALDNEPGLITLIDKLDLRFEKDKVYLRDKDISMHVRSEKAGNVASQIAVLSGLRHELLGWQRRYARDPGLVADGRDMGTVVFPQAQCKIFLEASAQERAQRRCKQLIDKGFDVNIDALIAEIKDRDERDRNRASSPLVPAEDAVVIDSSDMTIEQVVARIEIELAKHYS